MDYGFEAAGFETAVALEFDHDCCETLRKNRPWAVIERSIFDVPTKEILAAGKLKKGEADLLIGGPPCQPFSKSGYWARGDSARLEDPRSDTLAAYLRVVEEALPRAFVLENVGGLAFEGKDEGLQLLLSRIEKLNKRTKSRYRPVWKVLNAAEYGVPQIRERFFLVAVRTGEQFQFPLPRFAEPPEQPMLLDPVNLPRFRTAWDALGDLPEPPCCQRFPRDRTTSGIPSVVEDDRCLVGGVGIGPSSSSWRSRSRAGQFRPNRGRRSDRSTGRAVGSACVSSRDSRRFRTTSKSLESEARSRSNSETRCRHFSPR
jgi:DNA (cytosine-5)-methyltransferase 1